MADTNKIKYGLKSCYYAVITESGGVDTFGTPVALPGAVSLSLEAQGGEPSPFYADDIIYYNSPGSNGGYQGDLELAYIPDAFRTAVLGDATDKNSMIVEDADADPVRFAFLFEFHNDAKRTRHVMYNCTASRPAVASNTKEETVEPQTETITITAIPGTFGTRHIVKGKVTEGDTNYASFFSAVVSPDFTV